MPKIPVRPVESHSISSQLNNLPHWYGKILLEEVVESHCISTQKHAPLVILTGLGTRLGIWCTSILECFVSKIALATETTNSEVRWWVLLNCLVNSHRRDAFMVGFSWKPGIQQCRVIDFANHVMAVIWYQHLKQRTHRFVSLKGFGSHKVKGLLKWSCARVDAKRGCWFAFEKK